MVNKLCLREANFAPTRKPQNVARVLIKTAITSEILKTYTDFYIFVSIKDCTFWLHRLELPDKCHFCEISVSIEVISSPQSVVISRGHNMLDFATTVKLRK